MQTELKNKVSNTSKKVSQRSYSSTYQEKLNVAIAEARKSKTIQSVEEFLKDVRAW